MTKFAFKTLCAVTVFALLLPIMLFSGNTVLAEEDENWIFIDGENITRGINTAIAYYGVDSTEQTLWGHDIVIDADGFVTNIIEGGLAEGEDLAVPEGGLVISAAGVKVQWFKDNVKAGTRLFYDRYNQKLFLCDANGNFDPYFTKEIKVEGEGNYLISNPLVTGAVTYTLDIAVDANGTVIYRGSNALAPEGGFCISAATENDAATLMAYAPVGAKCTVTDGIATLTYNQTMLKRTAETLLINAQTAIYNSKMAYDDIDFDALDDVSIELGDAISDARNYADIIDIAERISSEITDKCHSAIPSELRGVFHTPRERDINEVRSTVQKIKSLGLNTLFLRTSNGYRSIIPLPESDKFSQDPHFAGFDVLKAFIDVCEEENIALVLTVDVFYNEYASIAAPGWMSETINGETDISMKYYSPASEEFREYFTDYVRYIVSEYEIKNLMLDHLRYPKFSEESDFGYDFNTLDEFAAKYGIAKDEAYEISNLLFDSPHWENWVKYRVSLVTEMAQSVSDAVREERSDVTLIAVAARDTVDYFYMQDTIKWIEESIFDGLCLELFESDIDENDPIDDLGYLDGFVTEKGALVGAYTGKEKFLFTALDTSVGADLLTSAISQSRNIGADGCVFGDLERFTSLKTNEKLVDGILKSDAVSPLQDTVYSMKMILEFAKTKISDRILPYGGCDEATATSALLKINEAMMQLSDGALSHDEADTLERDMAMLFATSSAKHSVIRDFEAVTKLALLHKIKKAELPPDVSDPFENDESNVTDESETSDTEDVTKDPTDESEEENEISDIEIIADDGIGFGSILIYLFVGATLIVAVICVIVGIRRKSTRPKNAHMPKSATKNDQNG
ncbi:MAG: family 10 glycosylhydrolase [Clostridia bacterium]|nr:family 10 glycosylhydrolase [Clostridia bacterium]